MNEPNAGVFRSQARKIAVFKHNVRGAKYWSFLRFFLAKSIKF